MSFLNHCNEPYDWWIGKGAKVNQLLTSLAGPNTGAGMFFEGRPPPWPTSTALS